MSVSKRDRFEQALADRPKGKKTQMLLRPPVELKEQIEALAATYGQTSQAVCDALLTVGLRGLGYLSVTLRGRKASKAA